MYVNEYGDTVMNEESAIELMYEGVFDIESLFFKDSEEVRKYNKQMRKFNWAEKQVHIYEKPQVSFEEYHHLKQQQWLVPKHVFDIDIKQHLIEQCTTDQQLERVALELQIYEKHELMQLLCVVKWLMDTAKQNNIITGVGRGSSCASLCLYLLGVHYVDPLKYDLNFSEFLT